MSMVVVVVVAVLMVLLMVAVAEKFIKQKFKTEFGMIFQSNLFLWL